MLWICLNVIMDGCYTVNSKAMSPLMCCCCSMHIKLNHYSLSLVSPLMCMHSRDSCMTLAVCVRITFRLVHVAIKTQAHPIPAVLKQVYGADSLATLKGGIGPAYEL